MALSWQVFQEKSGRRKTASVRKTRNFGGCRHSSTQKERGKEVAKGRNQGKADTVDV